MAREKAKQMSGLMVRLYSLCQERDSQFIPRYGLTNSEFRCLYLLLQTDNQAVNQLATAMSNSPSRLAGIIDTLIRKEFVKRVEPENDRRLKMISLTSVGRILTTKIVEIYHTMQEQILTELNGVSREQIIQSITALIKAMEIWKSKQELKKETAENKI